MSCMASSVDLVVVKPTKSEASFQREKADFTGKVKGCCSRNQRSTSGLLDIQPGKQKQDSKARGR